MADQNHAADVGGFRTLMFVRGSVDDWLPAVTRLLTVPGAGGIVLAVPGDVGWARSRMPDDDRISCVVALSFATTLLDLSREGDLPLLVMTAPVLLPADGLGPALNALRADARVATVSFLANSAGYLSFPYRNGPTAYAITGYDETTLTRRLRDLAPVMAPAPITVPAGAACLVAPHAVTMTGGPHPEFDLQPEVSLMDLALRSQRRGLKSVLDSMTYVSRPWELGRWGQELTTIHEVRMLLNKHHHFFPSLFDTQRTDKNAPIEMAMNTARAKVQGLRVVIDGSCLGPIENGTQVQTLALARALAERDDVHSVTLGVPGAIPRYADPYLDTPKISTVLTTDNKFEGVEGADIVHRPFQPGDGLPWARWRQLGERVVVTVQDLIAYGIGAYHFTPEDWLSYRSNLEKACRRSDASVVISHDVRDQMLLEQLPVERDRMFVIENGTDHMSGSEATSMPAEIVARGWASRPFMVVLGANYSHKNRDLAVRMWRELRERGHGIGLVLAGVSVAQGSSRIAEAAATTDGGEQPLTLADVTSEERNWLLRHAELCVYPTAAEGFGLVPFEAARFGTPTLHAGFGPLDEVMPDAPVVATSWRPADLADAAERLLADPALGKRQVESVLASGDRYTWARTAAGLVECYRELLSRPRD